MLSTFCRFDRLSGYLRLSTCVLYFPHMLFFVLGTNPRLSKAEIFAVLGKKVDLVLDAPDVLVVDAEQENPSDLQHRLGGTIKVGHILAELPNWNLEEAEKLLFPQLDEVSMDGKLTFGISVYEGLGAKMAGRIRPQVKRLGIALKKQLKEGGKSVRFVTSQEPTLSSVVVSKNHLLESGGEFVILPASGKLLIGKTEASQNFESWSARDYGRPARDAKSGMLPPKLARIMLNLSAVNPAESTVLDPFCGSGTVLMEAQLLGFKRIIGSDLSQKALSDTEKNLTWLSKKFDLPDADISLYTSAAEKLGEQVEGGVDVIVTETFLGTPRTGRETEQELQKRILELTKLYETSFTSLFHLMNPGARAVIAFPAFVTQKKDLLLPIEDKLKTIGFHQTDRFLYKRSGQLVARDIIVLQKGQYTRG